MMLDFVWICWVLITVVVIFMMGKKRRFVTRKLSGKYVVVNRIRSKVVKICILISTFVFSVILCVESCIGIAHILTEARSSVSLLTKIGGFFLPFVVIMMIHCYFDILRFAFNEASRLNDRAIKDCLIQCTLENEEF